MSALFKIVTADGVLVANNQGNGFGENAAAEDCARRNRAAEDLQLETRYEVVPFGGSS